MNPIPPPHEPLDEQEREFARILRALPGGEPSAAVDARILRASANATAAQRRPGARWLAAAAPLWGIGGAAAAVLALGVTWHLTMDPPRSAEPAVASAPRMSGEADDSPVAIEFKTESSMADAAKPAIAREPASPAASVGESEAAITRPAPARFNEPAMAAAPAMAPAAPPPPAPMPQPFSDNGLDEHVGGLMPSEVQADAAPASSAPSAAGASRAVRQRAEARASDNEKLISDTALARDQAQSAKSSRAENAVSSSLKPATWLTEIRRLRDVGETVQATESLREFRRKFPDYVIPSDLAPLLAE